MTVVRPGHTYGEGGPVLHSLGRATSVVDRIRRSRPVIVHGDGNGLWSALHADDVARVFVAVAGNSAAFGRAYNATGEEWMTWDQYHARIADALGVEPPPFVHVAVDVLVALAPQRAAQVARSLQYPGLYDMSRARLDLGWRQTIPFVDGIRRTVQWLDKNTGVDRWQSDPSYDRLITVWEAVKNRLP